MMPRPDFLAALRAFAPRDSRSIPSRGSPPTMCAFVSHAQERLADVALGRPALVVVLEGRKMLYAGGRTTTFATGTALALPAGWRGDVVNEPDPRTGFYRALFLDFPPAMVLRAFRAHPGWKAASPGSRSSIEIGAALGSAILHAAEALSDPNTSPVLVEHRVMEVLLVLALEGALPLRAQGRRGQVGDAVRDLVRWQPHRGWTAGVVAAELATSTATLRRRLAGEGTSLRELIASERMTAAAHMLGTEGLSVEEAALAVGYRSPRRFSGRFRAQTGRPARSVAVTAD
jgi:AraC-like DNA-binding protein